MNLYKTFAAFTVTVWLTSCTNNKINHAENKSTTDTAAKTNQDEITLTGEQMTNAGIETGTATTRQVNEVLKLNGVIDVPTQNKVSVSMPLGGYLKATKVLEGTRVVAGQTLGTMEDLQYVQLQQDYLTVKSRLEFTQAEYERQKQLNATKASSDKVLQQARQENESQKIQISALKEKLLLIGVDPAKLNETNISRSIAIKSPISGYISRVNVNPGKYVSPTDVLFEIVNASELHLQLTVFEKDAAHIVPGQQFTCYSAGDPAKKYEAEVHLVNPVIGNERSTEIHCHIKNTGKELLPGMFMTAELPLGKMETSALPDEAIVTWENEHYVFVAIGNNSFRMQKVSTGSTQGGYTSISGNVPTGKIAIKNAYALLMKLKNSGEE
jgi:cobalt-zinc-cadmium efflux system membrane fusion protein